ncbi:MAG: hypothetical protein ACJ8E5_15410 [Xanthobacteraceae bacterium]
MLGLTVPPTLLHGADEVIERLACHDRFDGFRASWRKACVAAGIVGVTFNDLRGTAVTRLALAGCTEAEIATITGHSLRDVRSILDAHYAPRSGTRRERDSQARKENKIAQQIAQPVSNVLLRWEKTERNQWLGRQSGANPSRGRISLISAHLQGIFSTRPLFRLVLRRLSEKSQLALNVPCGTEQGIVFGDRGIQQPRTGTSAHANPGHRLSITMVVGT